MTYDRYYYTRLSDREKKIYKTLYNGLTAFAPEIHIPTLTGFGIDPVRILYAVDMDNPHLFYVDFRHIPGHITALEKVCNHPICTHRRKRSRCRRRSKPFCKRFFPK